MIRATKTTADEGTVNHDRSLRHHYLLGFSERAELLLQQIAAAMAAPDAAGLISRILEVALLGQGERYLAQLERLAEIYRRAERLGKFFRFPVRGKFSEPEELLPKRDAHGTGKCGTCTPRPQPPPTKDDTNPPATRKLL